MNHRSKFLVIVDGTEELGTAIRFAAKRALSTKGGVVLLNIIEHSDPQQWQSVEDIIIQEARNEAEEKLKKWSNIINDMTGIVPEIVIKEGVASRLGENHYHMTTTTGGAARVMSWLEEFLQTEWLDMKVFCTSVTEQWAVLSISGPNSREFLKDLTNIDLSKENFPFMKFREGEVCGVKARIFRISFTGELSYEVNVPARYGRYVWEKFMEHGKKYNITPYGTETMHVLRAEKGFIIVGQDTDGSVTPSDMNMDWIVSKKKEDFLGKRSFTRPDTVRHDRKKFVGLLVNDKKTILPEGSHIVEKALKQPPMKMLGHVTSSYYSPTLGYPIALAMLKDGSSKMGEQVVVPLMNGKIIEATVTDTIFYDKEGKRNNE